MLGIFLDTETNGLNFFQHYPIEICLKVVDLLSGYQIIGYTTLIAISKALWEKNNPVSIKITGLSYEKISAGKSIQTVKDDLIAIFKKYNIVRKKAVFICQNPSIDRLFFSKIIDPDIQEKLHLPYHWLDLASMYWKKLVEESTLPESIELSKNKIAQSLGLPKEQSPHRAENGVDHLILCYKNLVGFATTKSI